MLTWAIAAALSCTPPQTEPAATVGVAELIAVRDISSLSASPDGTRAVYQIQQADLERDDYRSVWCLINFGAGDIIEYRPPNNGPNVRISFTKDTAPLVDLPGKRVVLDPPPPEPEGK